MRALERVISLLYPPRCISCKRPVSDVSGGALEKCFCQRCLADFKRACEAECRACGRRAHECECVPEALFRAGITSAGACFSYDRRRRSSPASRFIYSLKDTGERRSLDLAVKMLSWRAAKSGALDGAGGNGAVITFVPRSRKNVRIFGDDHMRLTAESAASFLGVGFADMFVNLSDGEQKGRDAKERKLAAAESFFLRRGAAAEGKRFILIDDIITSGASAAVCSSLLYGAGADSVSVFALAKTRREHGKL